MDKISSLRSMSAGNDEGLDILSEAVDVDNLQNAAKNLSNIAYAAASEASRNRGSEWCLEHSTRSIGDI
jgi:hypothetical protein